MISFGQISVFLSIFVFFELMSQLMLECFVDKKIIKRSGPKTEPCGPP